VLIEAGADVHARSKGGYTPLLFAARQGDINAASLLLDAGADINYATPEGSTALLVASASVTPSGDRHEDFAIFLLKKGADPKVSDGVIKSTALHYAVQTGKSKLVTALVERGVNVNAKLEKGEAIPNEASRTGATPFWLAAKDVKTEIMRVLLDAGADPLLTSDEGVSPLMLSAGLGQNETLSKGRAFVSQWYGQWDEDKALEALNMLIDLPGVNLNAVNRSGQTALHGAVRMASSNRVIQFLVSKGANLNAKDKKGQTPWVMANDPLHLRTEAADLLRKLGADTSDPSSVKPK
jgi:ankyrin repeat protein